VSTPLSGRSVLRSQFLVRNDIQSKLEPNSSERSESYPRAILPSLIQSIAPNGDPATPPEENGPPAEIVSTSNLFYASLSMSLLAAFVAMLGKQWLSRYLGRAGGSVIEWCYGCQRKFAGLKKRPSDFSSKGSPSRSRLPPSSPVDCLDTCVQSAPLHTSSCRSPLSASSSISESWPGHRRTNARSRRQYQ
jgi:hypothetical protein